MKFQKNFATRFVVLVSVVIAMMAGSSVFGQVVSSSEGRADGGIGETGEGTIGGPDGGIGETGEGTIGGADGGIGETGEGTIGGPEPIPGPEKFIRVLSLWVIIILRFVF